MPTCCSTVAESLEGQFDDRKAAEELASYRKKGPGPTTRLLEDGIARAGALKGNLLDIGAGIGALTFGLVERGLAGAIAVDASKAFTEAARDEAARRNLAQAIQFVHGDFLAVAPQLPAADVVTLDRVVCCYPSWEPLLDAALRHASACVALSYPRDKWYVRLALALENGQRRFKKNPFRTFVHPPARMEQTIRAAGFDLSSRLETWMWSMDVYVARRAT